MNILWLFIFFCLGTLLSVSLAVYILNLLLCLFSFFFFCGCGQFRKNIWNRYIKSAFLTRRNQANSWCISWFLVFFLYHSSYRTLVINVIVLLLLFYMYYQQMWKLARYIPVLNYTCMRIFCVYKQSWLKLCLQLLSATLTVM